MTSCTAAGRATRKASPRARLRRSRSCGAKASANVGLLFVVGEERGSDGAKTAQALASGSKFLINGEPTDNRLGIGTRGALRYNLRAKGRAAHSSFPELGVSAIEKLIDALVMMRTMELPDHPVLGRTHYTVGLIKGGVAPNVIPFEAEAEVMFRTVADVEALRALMTQLTPLVAIEEILDVPPVIMPTVPGFETATFPYTTDIPFLSNWGTPLLYGPGSIHVAHTDNEHVKIADLHRAVDDYASSRSICLALSDGRLQDRDGLEAQRRRAALSYRPADDARAEALRSAVACSRIATQQHAEQCSANRPDAEMNVRDRRGVFVQIGAYS